LTNINPASPAANTPDAHPLAAGSARLLSGRDVRLGALAEDEAGRWLKVDPQTQPRAGDVVLRALSQTRTGAGFTWARIRPVDLPVVAGHHLLALRPRPSSTTWSSSSSSATCPHSAAGILPTPATWAP
jgi:hypothetical protein